jgi:arylformamidase
MNLAAEYDNRALVPDHPAIIARWRADAAAFRASAKAELDCAYGARERNRYDLFGDSGQGPVVVFIHGGYWRSFDHTVFSHCAAGLLAHGLTVAVPTYTLCPAVTVPDIIDELRQFTLHLWQRLQRPLVMTGHSAGGHLAAAMIASNWEQFGLPPDVVRCGLAISGLFDLRPLLATPINDDTRLDQVQCLTASPVLWPLPRTVTFDAWVGAQESSEFIRQSRTLAAAWEGLGSACALVEMAGANHFTAVDPLQIPASPLVRRIVQLAAT